VNMTICTGGGNMLNVSSTRINIKRNESNDNLTKQASQTTTTSFTTNQPTSNTTIHIPKYETQASYDLSFFLLQQQVGIQSKLISPQLSLALFQFLSSC
jgi:hypothetical protein